MMQILQPPGWARAKGFSNGIACKGTLVFIAGQIGWTGEGKWEARDFAGQFRQALHNIISILKEANGKPEHIVRLTWYVLDRQEYLNSLKEVGAAYRFCGRAGRISTRLVWAPSRIETTSTTVWATSSEVSIQEVSGGREMPENDVSTEPGAIVVTLMPRWRTSSIRHAEKWSSAALLAQ